MIDATGDPGLVLRSQATAQVFVEELEHPTLSEIDRHHLFKVRRLRDGEIVIAADGAGAWRRCMVQGADLVGIDSTQIEPEVMPRTAVAFAPVKGDRGDWAVAKLTELGVDRIIALATDRAAVRWNEASGAKALERWRRIALESSCQSRRVRLPLIDGPITLSELVQQGPVSIGTIGGPPLAEGTSTIAIGPEGGWSDAELALGIAGVGLGSQVLRTETAAMAAGVLLGASRAGTVRLMEGLSGNSEGA